MTKCIYVRWKEEKDGSYSLMAGDCQFLRAWVWQYTNHVRWSLFFPSSGPVSGRFEKPIEQVKEEILEKFRRHMQDILQEDVTCDDIPF